MQEAEQEIYKEFKISEELFLEWLKKFENDSDIKGYMDRLEKISKQVFESAEP